MHTIGPNHPVGGDLTGSLTRPELRDSQRLHIGGDIFAPRFPVVQAKQGIQGVPGNSGGTPPGAYWININGGLITLPANAVERPMQQAGTLTRCMVFTKGGVGSCTIKVYKANISTHYPPVSGDDITGGANVVLTSGSVHDDASLSGWTKTYVAGDIFLFTLASSSVFTSIGISLLS